MKNHLEEHLRLEVQEAVLLRPQEDAHHLVGYPRVHPALTQMKGEIKEMSTHSTCYDNYDHMVITFGKTP